MQAIKSVLRFSAVLVVVVVINMLGTANAAASSPDFVLTANMMLAGEYTPNDIAFAQANLAFLQKHLPTWYQYITDAGALTLTIDVAEGAHGRLAVAKCCDASGRGTITFGFHLGQSPDDVGKSVEAQRIAFIGTLTHEAAHIYDQRAGRNAKVDRKSCIAAERAGLDKQLEVKQALASANLGGVDIVTLNQQIEDEIKSLRSRELWDYYCGAFEN